MEDVLPEPEDIVRPEDSAESDAADATPAAATDATEDAAEAETQETEGATDAEIDALEVEIAEEEAESSQVETTDTTPQESRMVIIGNSTFATDGQFSRYLNGDVFLNSVSWLSEIDNPTSIQPTEPTNRRLTMTVQKQILLMLVALVAFPLAGLVGAGTLWARRR